MSRLRPECGTATTPSGFTYESALYRVYQAVSQRRTLIHGRLHDSRGHACAIGCTFDDGVESLPTAVIDEVAAYNDSFPKLSEKERWRKVHSWLKYRTEVLRGKKK
jgi:hypothetical protein